MTLAFHVVLIILMLLSSNMKKVGVIGLGNPLRRDDGIGIILLEKLVERKHELPEDIQYIDGGTGGMNILHLLARFDIVFIIDAARFNATAGHGQLFDLQEIKNNRISLPPSTHGLDILEIIRLSKNLDKAPKHILFFGVQPKDTSVGTDLSKELQQNIEELLKKIMIELKKVYEELS
jgi:hydrogenase maturation protease